MGSRWHARDRLMTGSDREPPSRAKIGAAIFLVCALYWVLGFFPATCALVGLVLLGISTGREV